MAARVYQSVVEVLLLTNPSALVYQSVLEVLAIPGAPVPPANAAVNMRITLLGVKRRPLEKRSDLVASPDTPHVTRAV